MTVPIEMTQLCKAFGRNIAVNRLSLSVGEGEIFGFLGPNGAGKTTTMRILATLLRPDAGRARILGYDVVKEPSQVRKFIGYMPDSSGAYRDMRVDEYLEFFAAAYDVPVGNRPTVVRDCLELVGLSSKMTTQIDGLSRGMHQRLGLARCLINDPKVLILDEPASGLDPRARIEVQEVIRALGAMGKTVLISSHILSELRTMCHTIGIIERGSLIFAGSIDEALARARTARRLEIRVVTDQEKACEQLGLLDGVVKAHCDNGKVVVELDNAVADHSFVTEHLVRNAFRVLTVREEELLLEDAFIHLTNGSQGD